jgi:CheY-like chemotaxis protein
MKRILVVDDEQAIRLLYHEELTDAGYHVELAANAEEALQKLGAGRPDLMTVDVRMPGMDGLELVARVRERHRELPIIICTAYDYRGDFGTWAGDAYVTKSSDLQELKAKVQELLSGGGEKTGTQA